MYNNYYFIKRLAVDWKIRLDGYQLIEAYTQEKDEVIFEFARPGKTLALRVIQKSRISSAFFIKETARAGKNTVNLFHDLYGKKVLDVVYHKNERRLHLALSDNFAICFQFFGGRSNILIFRNEALVDVFKSKSHISIKCLEDYDRQLDTSFENFLKKDENPKKLYPTFDKLVLSYLKKQGIDAMSAEEKYQLIQDTVRQLTSNPVFLMEDKSNPYLTLLPGTTDDDIISVFENFNEAIKTQTFSFLKLSRQNELETSLSIWINKRKKSALNTIEKSKTRLSELSSSSYKETADVIMANLHQLKAGSETEIYNFYTEKALVVRLKNDETPQKKAERLYRKSKKQHLEVESLESQIQAKSEELESLESLEVEIKEADLSSLKKLHKETFKKHTATQQVQSKFKRFEINGFEILVGKNARNNDELTMKNAYKEDIWLHAKDVTGSHVLIKHRSGKTVPQEVLERAAALAAYYSKRKTDSLCPVIYTERKFVRKPKGASPGAVIVDKEKMIMVEPNLPN